MAPGNNGVRSAQSMVADSYDHQDRRQSMRPDVGTQAHFKKRKPPKTHRYDDSLDPVLRWGEGEQQPPR